MTAGWRDDFETVTFWLPDEDQAFFERTESDPYEARDRIQRTIEQQHASLKEREARSEELEGHIRAIITGADLHPGELPKGLVNALPSLRAALNQNPPNPRSAEA